jgi:aspartate aminotransferase
MPPSISPRGLTTPPSPIRKLALYATQARERGIKVYNVNIGQPDIHTPIEFYQAIRNSTDKVLAYGPSDGIPIYKKSLEQYYHRCGYSQISQNDIMVTTGGSEAIVFTMVAITSPGDEIIVFEPFYPNYNGFSKMAAVNLIPIATDPEKGYCLPSKEEIEAKINPKTRAILVCSPNNPTGTILTHREMTTVKDLALKHNLFVISDEVYREFVFEGKHTSILEFPELSEHAIVTDSISKRYSACGARLGCIVSKNAQVIETTLKFGQARLCPPTLEQVGASAVVDIGEKYIPDMIAEYKKRRDTIYEVLLQIPDVKCKISPGAFYMMVTFPVNDIEDFARWLLTDFNYNNETTLIAPGPGFYATPGRGIKEARIAYVLNSDDLRKAINVIKEGLKVYH